MRSTFLKWYGGKSYLASRIVGLFPAEYRERVYVEPYGGGAAVLLAKDPSRIEVYNDLNGELVNLFRVLRDSPQALATALTLTPYSEEEFHGSADRGSLLTDVERARRFFVRHSQSFGGSGSGWSYSTRQTRRGMAQCVSGWLSTIDSRLVQIIERLRTVQLFCRPALALVEKFDQPDTLWYFDPPYLPSARRTSAYALELSEDDHRVLLSTLLGLRGRVLLSGYNTPLYQDTLAAWRRVDFPCPLQSTGGQTRDSRVESVWLNWVEP